MADLTQYATTTDLANYGLPSTLLAGVTTEVQDQHLQAATALVKSSLLTRHEAPISAVGLDVVQATCRIAAWSLLSNVIGFNPGTNPHQAIKASHDDAMMWLTQVAKGLAKANVTDNTPEVQEGSIVVFTEPLRSWGDELP